MKFSLNLGQFYSNVDLKSLGHEQIIKSIGLQLGAIEEVELVANKYQKIYLAKVVSVAKHPNADKLNICLIDDNGRADIARDVNKLIQVVCGAPNVVEGMMVAWISPGAVVPSTYKKDNFEIASRELRGVMSHGMLASPAELDLSEDSTGILAVSPYEIKRSGAEIGDNFAKLYDLDDVVIDLENKMFTHRPDCFGILGVARELAGINNLKFVSPDWYKYAEIEHPNTSLPGKYQLKSHNEIEALVPRFCAQVMSNIKVAESSVLMQANLKKLGIRPINNVVDITNYYMQLTSQPTHAFDYQKLKQIAGEQEIDLYPRLAKPGEKLKLLNSKEITLTEDDLVICCNDTPVALAGIMGGLDTEVDDQTTAVVIECATFDMFAVRKTSMRHGIVSDALTRFNKGQSPAQNMQVLRMICADLCADGAQNNGGIDIGSPIMDQVSNRKPIEFTLDFVNTRLGTKLTTSQIIDLLRNVEIDASGDDHLITVDIPFWRMDLEIPEDIVEEIGRLFGYQNIESKLPRRSLAVATKNPRIALKNKIRVKLSSLGMNEVLTYTFVHGDLLKKSGVTSDPTSISYQLRNALSPELQFYRPLLISSLLAKVHPNIKSDIIRQDDNIFGLYEISKIHELGKVDELDFELPQEDERLALVVAGDEKTSNRLANGSAYYLAKKYLNQIINVEIEPITDAIKATNLMYSPYLVGRSGIIYYQSVPIGVIGEFDDQVVNSFKLPSYCAGFEISLKNLDDNIMRAMYAKISNFPKTSQDITIKSSTYYDAKTKLTNLLDDQKITNNFDYYLEAIDYYSNSVETSYTFRIWFWSYDKTLTGEITNKILANI